MSNIWVVVFLAGYALGLVLSAALMENSMK